MLQNAKQDEQYYRRKIQTTDNGDIAADHIQRGLGKLPDKAGKGIIAHPDPAENNIQHYQKRIDAEYCRDDSVK